MLTYEKQLERDPNWAMLERELYFQQQGAVHTTLRRLVERLKTRGIDYAVAGDLCMFFHGVRRFTDVVELLVTPEGLDRIHRELVGDGYVRPNMAANSLRDTENGVCITFLVSGRDPCDNSYNLQYN